MNRPRFHLQSLIALTAALGGILASLPVQSQMRYVVSPNGHEVTDMRTGLIWQRCAVGQEWNGKTCAGKPAKLTLAQAKSAGTSQNPPWRVPTRIELGSIVDKSHSKPSADSAIFPATAPATYWALRAKGSDRSDTWVVDFSKGQTQRTAPKGSHYVHLVR